jgi:hypothetical protein
MSCQAIGELMSPRQPWMRELLGDLSLVTIALEPEYTGGLSTALKLYAQWEELLFQSPLFSKTCRWRDSYIRRLFPIE